MRRKDPGSRWTVFTNTVTLHIVKDMVPIYTVENTEVHPHAENFGPQVCATKPQQGISRARGSRQAPKMCKIDSQLTTHVLYIYQHVMFAMQYIADI